MKRREASGGLGFEPRDAAPRQIVYAGVILVVGIVVSSALATGAVSFLSGQRQPAEPSLETVVQVPPLPRLELDGRAERATVEGAAEVQLQGYAWADRSAGMARIPIVRAMQILATEGWPDGDTGSVP